MKRQQVIAYQQDLFTGQSKNAIRQSDNRKDVNQAKTRQAEQANKVRQQGRVLAEDLMTIVC